MRGSSGACIGAVPRLCRARECSSSSSSSSVEIETSGDEVAGVNCDDGAVDASLAFVSGVLFPALALPTVICVAFARTLCAEFEFAAFPWPGTMTFALLGSDGAGELMDSEGEVADDLTDTIRGAARITVRAGIGSVVASSR